MKTKILIVEDEFIIAAHLKSDLEELGYEVCQIAASVNDAEKAITKHQPDIALLDIRLQGEKLGTDLGKQLLEEGRIPFIYLTSHFDKGTIDEAKITRPSAYLVKPFNKEDVYVAIEMAINNFAHRKVDFPELEKNSSPFPSDIPKKIKRTIQYINDHLDRKILLVDLAELSGWNRYHFARVFKKYTNQTPLQYILKARMEKAKTLLETTDHSLLQIAQLTGFESHSHFSQTFRKMFDQSPDAYRKTKCQ